MKYKNFEEMFKLSQNDLPVLRTDHRKGYYSLGGGILNTNTNEAVDRLLFRELILTHPDVPKEDYWVLVNTATISVASGSEFDAKKLIECLSKGSYFSSERHPLASHDEQERYWVEHPIFSRFIRPQDNPSSYEKLLFMFERGGGLKSPNTTKGYSYNVRGIVDSLIQGHYISRIDDFLDGLTIRGVMEILKEVPYSYRYFKEKYKEGPINRAAVILRPLNLKYVPDSELTQKLCDLAYSLDPRTALYIPGRFGERECPEIPRHGSLIKYAACDPFEIGAFWGLGLNSTTFHINGHKVCYTPEIFETRCAEDIFEHQRKYPDLY